MSPLSEADRVNELGSVGGSFILQAGLPRGSAASLTQPEHKRKIKIEKLQHRVSLLIYKKVIRLCICSQIK